MRMGRTVIAIVVVAVLVGCWDTLSWSPNGRYLAFVGPQDGKLWIWDAKTGHATPVAGCDATNVLHCRFATNEDVLVFREHEGEKDQDALLRFNLRTRVLRELSKDAVPYHYGVSASGRWIYLTEEIKREGASNTYQLVERRLGSSRPGKILLTSGDELSFPAVNPAGSLILFGGKIEDVEGLHVYDRRTGKTRCLIPGGGIWPTWLDDRTILYIKERDKNDAKIEGVDEDAYGTLTLHRLGDNSTQALRKHVYLYDRPEFGPHRREVAITAVVVDAASGKAAERESAWQVVAVDLKTGKQRVLTNEPKGAGMSAFSPKGDRVAYVSPPGIGKEPYESKEVTIYALDLATNRKQVVWQPRETPSP